MVPYPHAADDHQSSNAHALDEAGGGWLLPEDAFTPEILAGRLASLLTMPRILENAAAASKAFGRPDAANRLADMIAGLLPAEAAAQLGGQAQ
jgi:UDP-N-acetylglucosamine--N-acetylmuramyl-(pentapeptide) pyrophosphoryl-undecaprenol N-acetylglucosamine transferase